MRLRFVTLDVFTQTRLAGNPLAVVIDADGLEQPRMQAVAREFNLPETVFVLQPGNQEHRARLRIFTPAAELPFAGHPTVGTAVLLGCMTGSGNTREFVLEESIGLVRCHVTSHGHGGGHASFAIPRLPEETEAAPDRGTIAGALGLSEDDIGSGNFQPSCWSAGVPFTFVPVASLAAIARAQPRIPNFESAFGGSSPAKAYLFCTETNDPENNFHARMFAPGMGVPEDPATGSAAAAFAGLISSAGGLSDGNHKLRIEQGYEMGRPSLIELGLECSRGTLRNVTIGGHAVVMSEGTIEV
jgi:trans-2,3-dihydro-3-hydroxyanthranilate isomerase